MMRSLEGIIAVVTGAAGGIGRAVVKSMSEAGAVVVATDLLSDASIEGADLYLRHDVTDEQDWRALEATIAKTYGRLDALVNNAGTALTARFEDTPLKDWRRLYAINVESVVIGVQALLPLLRKGGETRPGGASIVNFSSIAGLRGSSFNAAYSTTKAAVKMLSKCMGAEFAALGYNIRCNSVHPGGIETPMMFGIMDRYVELGVASSRESSHAAMNRRHPIGRMGRPDEMAGGVVYLCSEAASFVTCSEFVMDGGYSQV